MELYLQWPQEQFYFTWVNLGPLILNARFSQRNLAYLLSFLKQNKYLLFRPIKND